MGPHPSSLSSTVGTWKNGCAGIAFCVVRGHARLQDTMVPRPVAAIVVEPYILVGIDPTGGGVILQNRAFCEVSIKPN